MANDKSWGFARIVRSYTEWEDIKERRRLLANLRAKSFWLELKLELIEAYGGKCACCGESRPRFLTLDHIGGGGKKERDNYKNPQAFYMNLKRRGFPKDRYQLLCMNCNFAEKHGRPCPHKMIPIRLENLLDLHGQLCMQALEIMRSKNLDYGRADDPFYNFRKHGKLGILVRLTDKIARLESYLEKGYLAVKEESVRDTVIDILNYTILFVAYLEDERNAEAPPKTSWRARWVTPGGKAKQ